MTEQLDLSPLKRAIQSLSEALAIVNDEDWFNDQPLAMQNTLIAGVIQHFEFVYELSTKMIKRQLSLEAANPAEIDHMSYRELMRTAAEKGLIDDVQAWFNYRQMRNITSHTYNDDKAQEVYTGTITFIKTAKRLLAQLDTRHA